MSGSYRLALAAWLLKKEVVQRDVPMYWYFTAGVGTAPVGGFFGDGGCRCSCSGDLGEAQCLHYMPAHAVGQTWRTGGSSLVFVS